MRRSSLGIPIWILGGLLALVDVAAIVADFLLGGREANAGYVLWRLAFVGGFVLLLTGLFLAGRSSRWVAAAFISIGAVAGAIPLYWTLAIPVAAIMLIVFTVSWAARGSTTI